MSKSFFARRTVAATLSTMVLVTAANAQSSAQALKYPETRKSDHTDTYHGTVVTDPYRWLEDDNSAETKAWVKAQNAVTDKFLEAMPQRMPVRKIYTELYNFERYGLPSKEGGRYFWSRNDGLQQQSVIYMAKSLADKPVVAIDPNQFAKDGTVALTGMKVSRNGRYAAYGKAVAGSDWQVWQVRDLDTGKDLADKTEWVKFSSAEWTPDGKGYFYSRYDAPKEGAALSGVNYFQKLYYHRIGTPQSADQLVYENPVEKEWGFGASVTDDGKHVIINVWKGSGRKNGLLVMPLKNGAVPAAPASVLKTITLDFDGEFTPIGANGNTLWVKTDLNAPRGRVVAIDLTKRERANWKTVVAETKDTLTSADVVGGKILAQYLQDAATAVIVHGLDGKKLSSVSLPGVGSASGFGGKFNDKETFYSYTSLINPTEIYRYDVSTGKSTLFKRPQTAFDTTQYETKREFVTSKDGTRFPIFIAHRKGLKLDGSNPTLLYGYGGFNVSETPSYRVTASTWMKMGGVYVSASIRGGGEYGAAWHDAGTKGKKQNVFDDFIAAGEWLVANKYTNSTRLAVNGGSNGGLLVGAVVNQRPDLFGAAIPQVGVMDMLRFHKFTIGWAWVSDYGTSDKPDDFKWLYAYSPLHNVASGKKYPPIMITTADHDDRVVPAHSFKYAAALQAADTGSAPKLIRIETSAGHGAGKPTSKIIEERADILAFIANAFDVSVK
ncbi:MAG: prolyl oligopeptidase family serine peptidase [Burkholderiales bacterium]|nr:S9 family peptidase [Rhodocyclaceae bacterium]MCA3019937.1 S9 family peptidase [Rhodocyclaceae bacterium]MCA3020757.1 S9 family peptidase [Rhodocyclaceae bacterium]MCA3024569.1 S9 family peptidase [Rhodocyclaceae bacterium]MCA3030429.1 S9 family peptidase [Rhodocyclaceae bacterium]